jgi:hypothetical protein
MHVPIIKWRRFTIKVAKTTAKKEAPPAIRPRAIICEAPAKTNTDISIVSPVVRPVSPAKTAKAIATGMKPNKTGIDIFIPNRNCFSFDICVFLSIKLYKWASSALC